MFILSDWSIVWFNERKKSIGSAITSFRKAVMSDHRWSGCMAQKNLIDYCLRDEREGHWSFEWNQFLEQYWYTRGVEVAEMKEPIFSHLQDITEDVSDLKTLLKHRGDYIITERGKKEEFGWSIGGLEFDQSIILWHIATDLYIHHEEVNTGDEDEEVKALLKISKHLSEYMFYLLLMCPFMMPKWIGIEECRFRYTCKEVKLLFRKEGINDHKSARKLLLPDEIKNNEQAAGGDGKSKSMLSDARMLVERLKSWEDPKKIKWEMIRGVWVEMLCYAASHCEWTQHGHQLRRGGEFLTHVYLLMSHLGFTQQLQIFQDQLQDARVIASNATRAAAKDALEAASSACEVARYLVPRITNIAESLYAGAAHALIVAAYADGYE